MGTPEPPGPLRTIARLLVRGPEARWVLDDLDEAYARDLERGFSPARARRRFLRNALGSAVSLAGGRLRLPRSTPSLLDVKLGVRMLRRQPALTAVSVFALAIGIPASMIPFHLVRAFQVDLPFDQGERIVGLRARDAVTRRRDPSLHDYEVWREDLESFETLGAAHMGAWNVISEDGRASAVRGSEVSASTFGMLRVTPLLGRVLLASDEVPGAPDVVVLGYDLWRSRLGGDPEVVGRTIRVGGVPHEVVGVMPEGFLFPFRDRLWLPLRARAVDYVQDGGPRLKVYGRLAEGVSAEEADTEVARNGRRLAAAFPATHADVRADVVSFPVLLLGTDLSDDPEFFQLQMLALLLLLVACGNVGILILARTASRTSELAIRTALGASRARVILQLFVETMVLAVLAAGLGLAIADVLANRLQAAFASEMPFFLDFGVTSRTVGWALLFAVGSALVAGGVPALKATGRGVQRSLQRATAGASGVRFGGVSSALIVAEVALAVCFLTLGGTLVRMALSDPREGMGIEPGAYLSFDLYVPRVEPPAAEVDTWERAFTTRVAATQREIVARLHAEPGVVGVALAATLPGQDHHDAWIEVEGEENPADARGHLVRRAVVGLGFFDELGRPVLSGRDFAQADLTGTDPLARGAVIVNGSFVHTVLGDRSAIGRRFRYRAFDGEEPGPWYEIVGVVGHLGMNETAPSRDAGFYHPAAPGELNPAGVAVHLAGEPLAFVPKLRRIAADVDAEALVRDPSPMDRTFSEARLASRWGSLFFALLSAIAIVLSAAGLYALIAFTVTQRTREIGIRTALGALPADIVLAVAKRAVLQLLVGVLLGAALSGSVVIPELGDDFLLSNVTWRWPVLVGTVAVGTLAVGLLACLPPVLRGLRIQPVEALKEG